MKYNIQPDGKGFRQMISDATGEVFPVFQECLDAIVGVAEFVGHLRPEPAILQLMNQSFNDFYDLARELQEGSGRAATRTARALIEHSINFASISSDDEMLGRYSDHYYVSVISECEAKIGANNLPSAERSSYLHELNKVDRDNRSKRDEVLSRHGASFRGSWSQKNLYERARDHDMLDFYPYYRIASSVMHGSSGGIKGTAFDVEGHSFFRLGPALKLCPLAYHEGVRAFHSLMSQLERSFPGSGVVQLKEKLRKLQVLWPKYRSAVLNLDKEVTPDSPLDVSHSCALISGTGTVKWSIVSPLGGWIMFCEEPQLYKDGGAFKDSIDSFRRRFSQIFDHDHWEPVGLPSISLAPTPGGKKYPRANFIPNKEWDELLVSLGFKKRNL
ncbi:DUF5677 domain-containing protein [Nocardiopsis sp. NPDC049922]|uniref:DUF5677 domain-containing protein n=1 Tax=Nocardiopsis sp. NPDC049922 TaxID=3155157 RepID=UPI0033C9B70D